MISFDEDFKKKMEYYCDMLAMDDLLPFRKEDTLPTVIAIRTLKDMLRDVTDMKQEIIDAILILKEFETLDELEKQIKRNLKALIDG